MINKEKSWKNNPWIIGTAMTVLGFLLTILRDFIKEKPVFTTVWNGIQAIYIFFIKLFVVEIKVWILLITILLIFLVKYIIKSLKIKSKKDSFNFKSYTTDNFKGFNWNWKWIFHPIENHFITDGIYPECKTCNTRLLKKDFYDYYYCPRCEKEYNNLSTSILTDIEGLIIDNLDKKKRQFEQRSKE